MKRTLKNEWLLEKTEEIAKDVFEMLANQNVEPDKTPHFIYNGHSISVPIFDETLRDDVNPIDYYGEENIIEYLRDAKDKGFM